MDALKRQSLAATRLCSELTISSATTVPLCHGHIDLAAKFPLYVGSREDWANLVLERLVPDLAAIGIEMPDGRAVRIGVGPLSNGKLGVCFPAAKSSSGTVNFIGLCTKQAEPQELVHTLIHEYLHACDDCQSGHRNRWHRWAQLLGMKRAGHERSAMCTALIDDALKNIGLPVQHEPSVVKPAANAMPSQVRITCPKCAQHVYMPFKAYAEDYFIYCGACELQMSYVEPSPKKGAL
jgi:hypothetical protein